MPERFKVVLDHARRYTSARLYLLPLGLVSQHAIKGMPYPYRPLKRVAVMFRVHSRHVELLLTSDVYNRR